MPVILSRKGGGGGGGGVPSGPAGGDLTGTYPNPTLADGAVTTLAGSVVGAYYTTFITCLTGWQTGVVQAAGSMTCSPIWLDEGTLDRIAQQHFGATPAGETYRMGIYEDDGRGRPGDLLLDAGAIDLSTAPAIKEITINQVVTRGLYWVAGVKQTSNTAGLLYQNYADPGRLVLPQMAAVGGTNLYDLPTAFLLTGVVAGLPDPFTGVAMTATAAPIAPPFVRYSA